MKDIIGYEGKYAIDEQGNVWSLNWKLSGKTRKMKPSDNGYGYLRAALTKDSKTKRKYVHRLVAQAFLPDWSEELCVDHIDRDKLNNNVSNLRMVSVQQNQFNTAAKGYTWHTQRNKWMAQIFLDGKRHYLGLFTKEEDARQAYLKAKETLHVI